MKKHVFWAIVLLAVLCLFTACSATTAQTGEVVLSCDTNANYTLTVGEEVDFTTYFTITKNGTSVPVKTSMLDLSNVNMDEEGVFSVKLTYGGHSCTATFIVQASSTPPVDNPPVDNPPVDNPPVDNPPVDNPPVVTPPADDKKPSSTKTTFIDKDLTAEEGGTVYLTANTPQGYDTNRGVQFLQSGGLVTITSQNSLQGVTSVVLTVATNAETGMDVRVKVGQTTFTSSGETTAHVNKTAFSELVTVSFVSESEADGKMTIELIPTASKKSMYILAVTHTCYGEVGGDAGYVMEDQVYDENTVDKTTLPEKMLDYDGVIGMPSVGTYPCLVVPIQFTNTYISADDLERLDLAFNGTAEETGWESVSSYYYASSYGKLDITFDVQDVYYADHRYSYYDEEYGDQDLLLEVMASLEDKLDLTQYDYNDDGCIDGIYLIYSAPVDYESDDSIFWAFTTWYIADESENQTFDNMDVYAYCFMGFDFMDEAINDEGTTIAVNAATYIHETCHMLGLDDYYDYYQDEGSNKGLGAADMMDSTVGDHNPYSKLMMGWVTPTVVTATETITLSDFATSGQFIMILLDYNGTYFSEYLLIDLYSAKGLNELHADVALSYLYDGEAYGVRVFHVSSEIDTPYEGDDYASFTKYNNSISEIPLIYLVEADGDKNYESSPYEDCCEADDLWQAGDKLSAIFPGYTRNDGARVNFDITINAVSADTADITITFAE